MKKSRPHYDTLGVNPDASRDDIKKAFRAKAKECHPDHHPGDKEKESEFKELSVAYGVLGDPGSRRQYDETGEAPPIDDPIIAVYGLIIQTFRKLRDMNGDNIFYVDVVEKMKELFDETEREAQREIRNIEQQIKKNDKLIKKIIFKKKRDGSFLHTALAEENRQHELNIERIKRDIETLKKAAEILNDYEFSPEKREGGVFDRRRGFGVDVAFDPAAYFNAFKPEAGFDKGAKG